MSLIDDLKDGLNAAKHELGMLGPRPPGDPAALHALAGVIRQEADNAADIGRLEAGIPQEMVFEGPAAHRFAANAHDTAASLFRAQHLLTAAADAIDRKASALHDAQQGYDRHKNSLVGKIEDAARHLPFPF